MSDFDPSLPAGWNVWSDPATEAELPQHADQGSDPDPRRIRELDLIAGTGPRRTRTVPLKTIVPLLIDAQERNSTWLDDFAEDTVVIDADLHEVLLAYRNVRRHGDGQRKAA